MRERRGHLHRLHHAGLSGQDDAVHGTAAGIDPFLPGDPDLRERHPGAARLHPGVDEQGAGPSGAGEDGMSQAPEVSPPLGELRHAMCNT